VHKALVARRSSREERVFSPVSWERAFDEKILINKVTLDNTCPISKETDYKKCAVRVVPA